MCIGRNDVCGIGQPWSTSCPPDPVWKVLKSAPSGGHRPPPLTCGLHAQCLPQRVQDGRGRRAALRWRKLATTTGAGGSHRQCAPLLGCDDSDPCPLSSPSAEYAPQSKESPALQHRGVRRNARPPQNCPGHRRQGKRENLSPPGGAHRDTTARRDGESHPGGGPWSRKRTPGKATAHWTRRGL